MWSAARGLIARSRRGTWHRPTSGARPDPRLRRRGRSVGNLRGDLAQDATYSDVPEVVALHRWPGRRGQGSCRDCRLVSVFLSVSLAPTWCRRRPGPAGSVCPPSERPSGDARSSSDGLAQHILLHLAGCGERPLGHEWLTDPCAGNGASRRGNSWECSWVNTLPTTVTGKVHTFLLYDRSRCLANQVQPEPGPYDDRTPWRRRRTGNMLRGFHSALCEKLHISMQLLKPVTNQVTTTPGISRHNSTNPDTSIRLACDNPTQPDVIGRNGYAW